jgi:AAA domain
MSDYDFSADPFTDESPSKLNPNGVDQDWRELPPINQADVARWRGKEPPETLFTVEDLIPQGMVTLLTGIGGAGKTLLEQMAGSAIAASTMKFLGKTCMVGRAAGVFAEDPDAVLHLRRHRIHEQWKLDYDRIIGRYFPQSYFGLSAQLWRQGKPTRFMAELEQQLREIEALRLLTLDNAALLYAGDENSRPEVTEFISELNGLADRVAIGILLSAHPSKSNDGTALRVTSGSTAWVNACRSVLELKPGEDNQAASLTVVKANHAATGTTIELEWRDKLLVPVGAPSGIFATIERRTCERVFLDLLDMTTREGRHVSDSDRASNYAPKVFTRRPDRHGYKKEQFEHAMNALFAAGEIKMQPYRYNGHDHDGIARMVK